MASGSIVEAERGSDGAREKQRYSEHKVYTRKAFKGPRKNVANANASNTVATTVASTTTTTIPATDNSSVINANNETPAATNTKVTATETTTVTTGTATTIDNDSNGKDKDDNNDKQDDADHVVEKNGNGEGKGIDNGKGNYDSNNESNSVQVPRVQNVALEEANFPEEPPILRLDVTSNDSADINVQQVEVVPSTLDPAAENGVVKEGLENTVKINLASKSKQEMRELRRKLETELDVVRNLVKRIEVKEQQLGVGGRSNLLVLNNGLQRVNSAVGPLRIPRESATPVPTPTPTPRQSRPLNQLSISVLENSQGAVENVEKEKRTPKANQFYRNSEFLLAKDKFPPPESNKKSKLNLKKQSGNQLGLTFGTGTKVFKNCSALLEKLMKHKHGWVFNTPVDVKTLGLTDYFTIIKHPMDLGTVKSRLNKNWYKSPEEFAEGVRLTFHNAMTYNPKGQDVHVMAEVLLNIFEERWATIKSDYDREMRFAVSYDVGVPMPTSRKAPPISLPPPLDMRRILDRSDSMAYTPADGRLRPVSTTPSSRTPAPKKPKAKDPHKRDMTYEEKQKLSTNLQNLPSDKLDNIVQIIKKRNSALSQHDDEIEVDIDSVDAETLWELDRFVTNYKKSLSKNKRKAELAIQARAAAEQNVQEKTPVPVVANMQEQIQRDERNVTTSSPVQLEKQGDNGSRSSSSSSDSGSSSSDSDSDSSSASGSDIGQ